MNAWSNIQISSDDPEIVMIDSLEKSLGELTDEVQKIRELITRFEVCHFKYQVHLKKIKDSITELKSTVDTTQIGINHIRHGEKVLETDATGKSLTGQQYVWALKEWLQEDSRDDMSDYYNNKFAQRIKNWLGDKDPNKIRLVRLLLARLTWDWASYETLQEGGRFKDLEFQTSRMDICHYAFPQNLDVLIKAIGRMEAVEEKEFEGCGSYNAEVKAHLEKEFLALNDTLRSFQSEKRLAKNDLTNMWLRACLAKTIKESIHLSTSLTDIVNRG